MLPIGQLTLFLALGVALLLFFFPLVGVYFRNERLIYSARPLAVWLFLLILLAFILLGYTFWLNDFSYLYIANNSNTQLPWFYQLTAIWGGHEGSMLLWVFMLAFWMMLVVLFTRQMPVELSSVTLAILGGVIVCFLAFLIFTSSPFARNIFGPIYNGADLNPLLQDPGLIIHPPLLYLGYVGFSVPFAFVCALLTTGHVDQISIRWVRPWVLAAWLFLTLGITIGSWWAYYELGWGGWWFWDPVENASLIPWILGAALLHSLAMTEKRNAFTLWSVLLAIFTFALSVLGTFLVRSGILTSVHSFAADPKRGLFILLILAVITFSGLLLLFLRAHKIKQASSFGLVSKETSILFNNIFFAVGCFVVLLGTLFPLIIDILELGKISVGEGYFNQYVVPISCLLLLVLGVGPLLRFKEDNLARLKKELTIMAISSLVLGVGLNYLYAKQLDFWVVVGLTLSVWAFWSIIFEIRHSQGRRHPGVAGFFRTMWQLNRSRKGMMVGHLGFIALVIGITLTTHYSIERDVLMRVGERIEIKQYGFELQGLEKLQGPNYFGDRGTVQVFHQEKPLMMMYPEKRIYTVTGTPLSEVALRASPINDLYVAMAEERGPDTWALRIYVKPFVRWIWIGGGIMAFGAFLSITDYRYRRRRTSRTTGSSATESLTSLT